MESVDNFRRNCTLVAIRELTRAADEAVLAAFRKHGYRENKGCHPDVYVKAGNDLGLDIEEVPFASLKKDKGNANRDWHLTNRFITVKQFLDSHPKGDYIIRVHGHAFAIRKGVILDHNMRRAGLRRRVTGAWIVKNAPQPIVEGKIRLLVPPIRARRPGTRAMTVYLEMWNYVQAHPSCTKEDLFRDTTYEPKDWRWDIQHSNITIV